MKLAKKRGFTLVELIVTLALLFVIGFLFVIVPIVVGGIIKGAKHVDENGGVKAVAERVWEGNGAE